MLDRVLPRNSKLRRQLQFVARRANWAVTPNLTRNFTEPSPQGAAELRELLVDSYFPSWYEGLESEGFAASEEGRSALEMHVHRRLEMDRYELVPWLNSILPLEGVRILEVGCGTGSATVALAEQGARVTAFDIHDEALLATRKRCEAHNIHTVQFLRANAQDIGSLFQSGQFDIIFFFAVLEHMTLSEREAALRGAWSLLGEQQYLCIGETPNRLWPDDTHTSQLAFFNWLPDEIAFRYARYSPLTAMRSRFREITEESMLRFRREGRGVSFHELDLALDGGYQVRSDQVAFLAAHNPIKLVKRILARDGAHERALNSHTPRRHRAFFREYLNFVIQKSSS
jgi:2-polyprenyl-3-methyl-5-hydroxy-6-metoxy-1,4-benzoquinol methylase